MLIQRKLSGVGQTRTTHTRKRAQGVNDQNSVTGNKGDGTSHQGKGNRTKPGGTVKTKKVEGKAPKAEVKTKAAKAVEPVKVVEAPKPKSPIKSKGSMIARRQEYFDRFQGLIKKGIEAKTAMPKIHEQVLAQSPKTDLVGLSMVYYVGNRLGLMKNKREQELLASEKAYIAAKSAPKAPKPKATKHTETAAQATA